MAMTAQVSPSPEARDLFNNMVAFAQPAEEYGNTLLIDVGNVLVVGCQRARQGLDAMAKTEIGELLHDRWIAPAPTGGWFLG